MLLKSLSSIQLNMIVNVKTYILTGSSKNMLLLYLVKVARISIII